MFDNFIFTDGSFSAVSAGGKTTGFEIATLLPYYRGIPMSMINDLRVQVDGADVNREDILFSTDRETWFSLSELGTVTSYKWEYGQQGWVRVKKALGSGKYTVTLTVIVRTAYIPVPLEGTMSRTISVD
jgi:hypothetical protein